METPIVEKSTLKGIIIGFSICCLLSLTVFVSKAVNFEAYRINSPEKELTQEKWNSLVTTGIEKFLNKYNDEDLYKYKFPIGTVVMYAKSGGCPKGWEQWGDGLDGKFIMPLQTTDGTALMYGGSKSFTILNENLPKHSHKFIYDGKGSAGVSETTYLASNNYGNQNYGDYDLKFNSNVATVGLTSREGGDEPIEFMPKYAKVLFCIKVSDVGGEQEEEEEGNNGGEQQEVVQTYTVKFNCNGGGGSMTSQTYNVGETKALSTNTCTHSTKNFGGWATSSAGEKVYDDGAVVNPGGTAGATITLYAVWQQIDKTYTVEYDCNGGSGTPPESQTFTVGQAGTLNANTCTKTSPWKFQGWSTAKLGDKEYNDKATVDLGGTANSTITLHAIWKREINLDPDLDKCPVGCFYVESEDKCYKNSCFIAGTKVIMADGSEKNIEDINKGDMVLGAKGEYNTVQGLHMPKLGSKKLWSINGGKNFFTEEHPFMTTEGWKSINSELAMQEVDLEIGELQVGDVLITNNGYVVIKSLEGVEGDKDTQLYNLMLDGDHTYYADDYLVHNKVNPYSYEEGAGCRGNAEMRGDGCCPLNTWGKGNECVPLCSEGPDPDPTTTYRWKCVDDSSYAGSCYDKSITVAGGHVKSFYQNACSSISCPNWTNQNSCEKATVCKQSGAGNNSYLSCHWAVESDYSDNISYSELVNQSQIRCCVRSTRHAVCVNQNGNLVHRSNCSISTKPSDQQCVQQQDIMLQDEI